MKEVSRIVKKKERVSKYGQMVNHMLVNFKMIKKMDMEFIIGQMGTNTKDFSQMEKWKV